MFVDMLLLLLGVGFFPSLHVRKNKRFNNRKNQIKAAGKEVNIFVNGSCESRLFSILKAKEICSLDTDIRFNIPELQNEMYLQLLLIWTIFMMTCLLPYESETSLSVKSHYQSQLVV